MQIYEILLMALALSMDACAVGMTDGMTNAKMPLKRTLLIGGFFGFFQFLMPLIGYFITGIVANAFLDTFERISGWISFLLLAFLGGKMILDCVMERRAKKKENGEKHEAAHKELSVGKLFMQAIATSIDALAVGVTLQMAAISAEGLAMGVWGATLTIGAITLVLSIAAVYIGKFVGNKLADKAEFFGGLVLLAIGVKILVESLL